MVRIYLPPSPNLLASPHADPNPCRSAVASRKTPATCCAQVMLMSKVRVVQLAMGKAHMLALDDQGVPYAWGDGRRVRLRSGSTY